MPDLTGQTMGKYQLTERLGRGGMADVYKGYQPGLDRYVAVKVLHSHLAEDADFINRFKREAKTVAELRHPHIVQVFDFDVQGENYYMVMEYIPGGRTLKEILQDVAGRKERLSPILALDVVAKLADALEYAHRLGMVHRDIKPSNILIPSPDRPVLSDFGIARIMGATGLTASGAMIGTPAYMSPEQGRGEPADERSDIYALGVVLYEMVTGQPPYDADTPYGVILKHINDPIVPPHVLVGELPDAIERVVLKSLAKNPDDRYDSMAQMRDALRAALDVLQGAETAVSMATPPVQVDLKGRIPEETTIPAVAGKGVQTIAADLAAEWPDRRRPWWPWAAGTGLVLAIVLVVVGLVALDVFDSGSEGTAEGGAPQARPEVASAEAEEPGAPEGELEETSGGSLEEAERLLFDVGDPEQAAAIYEEILANEPDNPHALIGRGLTYLWRSDEQAAKADLDHAAEIAPDEPFLHYARGLLFINSERYYDAEQAYAEFSLAIDGCDDDNLCILSYYERGLVLAWHLERHEEGLADMAQALAYKSDPAEVYWIYESQAEIDAYRGNYQDAVAGFVAAYEGTESGDYLEHAAATSVLMGDLDQATAFYEQLLEDFPGEPHYLVGQGYIAFLKSDFDQAAERAHLALELDPVELGAHYLLGVLAFEAGDYSQALAEFEYVRKEADDIWEYAFPFFTEDFGHEIHLDMARAALAMGDLGVAQEYVAQSLELDEWWPWPHIIQARIFIERGNLAGAREHLLFAQDTTDDPAILQEIDTMLAELTE